MRRLALALLLLLLAAPALAQYPAGAENQSNLALIAPTVASPTDNSNRIATTAWVNSLIASGLTLSSGKIWIGSAGNIATPQTPSGDCTLSLSGVITCTQAAGNFQVIGNLTVGGSIIDGNGILATNIVAPATPAAGTTRLYVDSTTKALTFKNDAGTVGNAVVPSTCGANLFGTSVSAAGVFGCTQPAISNLSGFGTGIAAALAVNIGSAGAPVLFNGAGGTPSSMVGTNFSGTAASLTAGNATKLATTRAIAITGSTGLTATGQNFDGSAAINLPLAGTLAVANGGTGDTGTAWAAYTPTAGCNTGTLTTSSTQGRWKQIGKTVFFSAQLTITTNGTCAVWATLSLPVTAVTNAGAIQVVVGEDNGALSLNCSIQSAGTVANVFKYDGTYPGANGKVLYISGNYEAN